MSVVTIKSLSQDLSLSGKGTQNYLVIEKPDGSTFRLPVSEETVKVFVSELQNFFDPSNEPMQPPQPVEESLAEPMEGPGIPEFGGNYEDYQEEHQFAEDPQQEPEDASPNNENEVPSV